MSNYDPHFDALRQQRRERVESNSLFYYRAADGGGIEQVAVVNHQVTTRRISRKLALETAKHLSELVLRGWTEDE